VYIVQTHYCCTFLHSYSMTDRQSRVLASEEEVTRIFGGISGK
jgi:hypothetical protein